jgi:hypothetical protein
MLRHKIVGHSLSSPPSSPSPTGALRPKELGISVTQKDIKEELSQQEKGEESRTYWPVPGSSSMRIGECAGVENVFTDELPGLPSVSSRQSLNRSSMSVSSFFGLKNDRCTAGACVSGTLSDTTRWISYPPYRFGVEFWDVGSLREKSHLYSQTIWYAGSLFNVFVQMFRKKAHGPQLGVYLHRQSSVDPIPPLSIPSGSFRAEKPADNKPYTHSIPPPSSIASLPIYPTQYSFSGLPVVPSPRSGTPVQGSPSNSSFSGCSLPATGPPIMPPQPYRDPRAQVSAYFAISCASATGSSVTRFTSNPDDFSVSQSWGWRSSSLRAEVCLDGDKIADPFAPSMSEDIQVNSMRVTVILGVTHLHHPRVVVLHSTCIRPHHPLSDQQSVQGPGCRRELSHGDTHCVVQLLRHPCILSATSTSHTYQGCLSTHPIPRLIGCATAGTRHLRQARRILQGRGARIAPRRPARRLRARALPRTVLHPLTTTPPSRSPSTVF